MRKKNKIIIFILSMLSVFFISCGKEVEKIEESKFLFGTYIKIIVYSDNKEKAMESIEKAFNEFLSLAWITSSLSVFLPLSLFSSSSLLAVLKNIKFASGNLFFT